MPQATGSVRVYTFKEGILSRAAHDLRLVFQVFRVDTEGELVRAEFELASLRVEGVMRGGALHAGELTEEQRVEIERALREDVLGVALHPRARFEGEARASGERVAIEGELELAGGRAAVGFEATVRDGVYRARFQLAPSRFGIAQYRAFFGAIRLRDHVEVELELALSEE